MNKEEFMMNAKPSFDDVPIKPGAGNIYNLSRMVAGNKLLICK